MHVCRDLNILVVKDYLSISIRLFNSLLLQILLRRALLLVILLLRTLMVTLFVPLRSTALLLVFVSLVMNIPINRVLIVFGAKSPELTFIFRCLQILANSLFLTKKFLLKEQMLIMRYLVIRKLGLIIVINRLS